VADRAVIRTEVDGRLRHDRGRDTGRKEKEQESWVHTL